MATRSNRLEYPFEPRVTSLASTTRHDFAQITVKVPETGSRSFKHVYVEITARDDQATPASITAWLIGIKLGSTAFSDTTVTTTISNSGEQHSHIFRSGNLATYFNDNFGSGATQTCQVGVTFTGSSMINICAKLVIGHYDYDDSSGADTRSMTMAFPLETIASTVTDTLTEVGTNQIPDLEDALQGLAGLSIEKVWIEADGQEVVSGTTNFQYGVQIDSETEMQDGVHVQNNITSGWFKQIFILPSLDTAVAHAAKHRSTLTGSVLHPSLVLWVTVTWDYASVSTTKDYVSMELMVGQGKDWGHFGGTTSGNLTRYQVTFNVQEANVTLLQSGVQLMFYRDTAITGPTLKIGTQTARTYTDSAGTLTCGMTTLTQRLDSGSAQGAGHTLARGENTLNIDVYQTASNQLGSFVGMRLFVNYRCDKVGGSKNHTIKRVVRETNSDSTVIDSSSAAFAIPEAAYWLNNVGASLAGMHNMGSRGSCHLLREVPASEGRGDGWENVINAPFVSDGELTTIDAVANITDLFRRFPADFDTKRINIETAVIYRIARLGLSHWLSVVEYVTYHAITQTVTGEITGYTGDGSGITVDVHANTGTKELLAQATSTTGGDYSATCYDDTVTKKADARQDGTHMGRSDNGTG